MSGLEPLAALGLAGNIFQFVEAAAKLCSMVIQIRRKTLNDILKEHFQPAEIARKMGCCVQALRANKYPTCHNKDETRLNDIADECISISEELNAVVQLIENRYVAVSEESSKIVQIAKGFRLGAQLLQTRSRVRDLAKRLDDHRNLLTDAVVACIPEKIDKMHKDLGETAGGARGFYKGILDAINSNDQRLDEKMQELRESVNKLVNKRFLEDVTVARSPDTLLQDSALQLGDASFASGKPTDLLYTLIAIARDASPLSVEDGILDSLSFKLIEDRKTSVKPAYHNTFEWILDSQPSGSPQHPENEFPRWLLDGSGIFWLPGKAGCGKSTLMKFLLAHHQLKSSLLQWAGEDELLITSYFFWAAGSSLQKNQEGLLRSLLFSILSQRKDLLPKLFPYRYNAVMNKSKILFSCCEPNCAAVFDKAQEMSWHLDKKHSIKSEKEQERITSLCEKEFTISELYHVFLILAQNFTKGLKIALVVDGLDEYQGDQSDLVDLFKKLTAGSNIKAIVSSRPEPLFTDALRTYPSLRMDLLTRRDMELYVKSKLGNQLRMQHLLAKDAGILEELSKSVATQSSGVFLWTTLVVKLLREMLEDGCFLHELQQAVYAYPVEISDLYRHMLLRMREGHKSEGFRIFRLAQLAKQIEGCFPSLLRFWFFVSELPGGSVQASSELPDRATFQEQLEITTKRIQSRCCGLLECVTHAATGEDYDEGLVKPFHRTVSDFLREPDVIDMIEKQTGDFQPHSRLLETILWCLKRKWVWRTTSREHWEALKKQLELVMVYLGLSEDRKTSRTDYLNTLDEAMVQFWGRKREAKSRKAFADYQNRGSNSSTRPQRAVWTIFGRSIT
ncbi:hypothetical protein N8I77_007784 [Diaporthe amygdali]|uniref:C2H2-type domain-containing protein n=1 Tax=Phomopsis amygdali TaxID=1214568 RepID=A0AAD9SCH1_PHOAM|nr:hypothetical protein N8I77_007784 [Diaporthe amygdali]